MSACSPGFPLPPCIPSILPQRYQVWRPALPRQAPWPSQRHAFWCSSICPLEAVPSWGTWEVPPHKYDGDARQGGMPLCDCLPQLQLSLPYVSAPESHTFSFLPCHDMTLRDGRCPSFRGLSHLCTGPPAKVFGRVGHGEGGPFSKKVSLPASFSPKFSPASNFQASAAVLAAYNVPLGKRPGDDHSSQPATKHCPPAGERQA